MKIETNQLIPLSDLHNYIDTSGIYEIICIENKRAYVGQSKSITRRIFGHTQALDKGNHSNSLLQEDWGLYTASAFVFRILQEIDYKDDKALLAEETREIIIRRRNGIMLYNDYARQYQEVERSIPETIPADEEKAASSKNQESPSPRKQPIQTYQTVFCYDCGAAGDDHLTHFKCDDGIYRCQICIEDYLGKQTIMIAELDDRPPKHSSAQLWRWLMGSDNAEIELTLALSSFARKFNCKPQRLLMSNPPFEQWQGVKVEHSAIPNAWYIDMPIPID
jgi:hypothetical protein